VTPRLPRGLLRAARPLRRRWRNRGVSDWVSSGPDFVGVGGQRCGTTWWWRLVCDHPRIHVSAGKEVHYFDRFFDDEFTEADARAYQRLFAKPDGFLTGEWTPRYMHDFWTPSLLSRAAPDAKILVILRDPLARYQSGISHDVDVLKRRIRRRSRPYVAAMTANDALSRSLYAQQLGRVLEHFDRDRVLVLQYERCAENPSRELRRTYEFIGAEPADHVPEFLTARVGRAHQQREPTGAVTEAARATILEDAAELGSLLPEIDLGAWPSCAEIAAPRAG
jgi:hypothetical protein